MQTTTRISGVTNMQKKREAFLTQTHSYTTAQTPCIYYMQTSQDLYERLHFNQRLSLSRLSLAQFLSLWCWGVKFGVRTYQLWQLPGQHGWLWMIEVSGSSLLNQFLAALLISHRLFACGTNNILKVDNRPSSQEGKQTSQEFDERLRSYWTRHQSKMLIAVEVPKL